MSQRISISCNPANPVNYLVCCGLFDLLAPLDAEALGWWQTQPPVACALESKFSEAEFTATVLDILSSASRWKFVRGSAAGPAVRLVVE